jgi:catechol 2,3-dioxygenase-like lactoylglutathione lyase family enzyme
MIAEHVGLTVSDLDRSIGFYTGVFGYRLLRRTTINAYLHLGEDLLELMQGSEPAPPEPSSPEEWQARLFGAPGLNHVGFRVDDLDAAIRELEARGGRLVVPPVEFEPQITEVAATESDKLRRAAAPIGRTAWRIAMFADPDGTLLELLER